MTEKNHAVVEPDMDLSTSYRYNQNMMEYYTCKGLKKITLYFSGERGFKCSFVDFSIFNRKTFYIFSIISFPMSLSFYLNINSFTGF